jgi:acetyltransferase
MNDALDYIKGLTMPPLKGNKLAVVSRSGGHAVITADACAHYGFELPQFPAELLRRVESRLRAHVIRLQNPLDLGDLFDLDFYENIVEEMLKMEDVDGVLLGHAYTRGFEQEASRTLIGRVAELSGRYQKPVALVIFAESMEIDYLKKNYDIPIFNAPENAMRAFSLSRTWFSGRSRMEIRAPSAGLPDRAGAAAVLKKAGRRDYLLLSEGLELLEAAGIPVPPFIPAQTEEKAVEAWKRIGRPVAMKLNRPHISHKTDQGAVRLGLDSESAVKEAFAALENTAGADRIEVLVQAMSDPGLEVMAGAKRDDIFGPVVLFGLGGIFVEALGDVVWRVAPFGEDAATRMLDEIRAARLLDQGFRGMPRRDKPALKDLLLRMGRLIDEFPEIMEMDVNPVLVGAEGEGLYAVDARVLLSALGRSD